jgi:hypothetical protein
MLCKIWAFHGGDYEECRLLGYKNPVRTSQQTHYVSTTESSRLMLCKIWVFHGGDYEECRLLGYKNPGRTSQETHYVSTTESSRLMLCLLGCPSRWHSLNTYRISVRSVFPTWMCCVGIRLMHLREQIVVNTVYTHSIHRITLDVSNMLHLGWRFRYGAIFKGHREVIKCILKLVIGLNSIRND